MFTKALIKEIPRNGSNIYKIRIPLFEDTTGTEIIYDALCCHAPGVFGGLNEGDCVYVSFEDAKLNIPVIIGRLFINEKDEYSKGYFNTIKSLYEIKSQNESQAYIINTRMEAYGWNPNLPFNERSFKGARTRICNYLNEFYNPTIVDLHTFNEETTTEVAPTEATTVADLTAAISSASKERLSVTFQFPP